MKWGFGKQQMASRARIEAPASTAANDVLWPKSPEAEAVPSYAQAHPSLELIGQQDERMRVRISAMLNRLDDLATFRDEFVGLTESVGSFAAEYPQLRAKLLETERLLSEEREASETNLRDARALRSENRRLSDDLSEARAKGQELSDRTKQLSDAAQASRAELAEREALLADVQTRLFAQTERASLLSDENAALKRDLESAEATVARQDHALAEARQTIELLENDNRNLRTTGAEQASRIASLSAEHRELEQRLQSARHELSESETRLAAEKSARERAMAQAEAERSNHQSALASAQLKADGLASRLGVTEKLLNQVRDQVRERAEELRLAERRGKDLAIEKNTLERRLESAQKELADVSAAQAQAEKAQREVLERAETLAKELHDRDAALAKAEHRVEMLLDRLEQVTKVADAERDRMQARIEKLTEELSAERAEKAIVQGALETARRSRVEIHREFLRIKNASEVDDAALSGPPRSDERAVSSGETPPSAAERNAG
jgi:crescentin